MQFPKPEVVVTARHTRQRFFAGTSNAFGTNGKRYGEQLRGIVGRGLEYMSKFEGNEQYIGMHVQNHRRQQFWLGQSFFRSRCIYLHRLDRS